NRPREAELNFEKALAVDPTHAAALDALVALATEAHEVRRAIDWRRKRLQTETEPDARVDELLAIAAAHGEQLQDTAAALAALDEALAVAPKSRASLEKLRAVLEKHGRWAQLVDVLAELAATAVEPKERGALSFAGADVALGRLRDEDRGLPLLERALEDDPAHDAALQALVAVRTSRGEWQALDATYARLVDRFAVLGDVERAWDTCRKLAVVRRDKLRDAHGAVEGFAGAVRCKPDDVDSRAMLADAYLAVGDEPRAVAEFERIAQLAPTRASTHARLFALHRRAGRTDRAWLAGAALEELGAADMDQQLVVDQYRLDGPIRPSRSLDGAAWSELLRAPGSDDVVADVLRSIAPAAISRRVDELRQSRQLAVLDPARRQSAASTVTAVRSFQWAAQVLGVEAPDLYVMDAVPGGIAAVRSPTPATALGPDVLRGLTTKDLAFLAARHLTYYRPEHVALIYYPTVADLSVLFLGALLVAMPDLPVPPQSRDAATRTRKALARQVGDDDRRTLVAAVERLEARGGRADLAAWIRGVELAAQRAGLLLCGDLAVAVARLRADGDTRPIGELTFDDKRGDLLAFSASEQLARAREALSVDLPSSGAGAQAAAAGQLQAS
ncbi:MAG TPA: hypothetical protein VE987_11615, partial [Polyangiaceae bacterium]|nr:hypothetical protein [Polyangiaceae bacterium]